MRRGYSSLPRRRAATCEEPFPRLGPARRSAGAGAASGCVEYFVPRSLSEFNLSAGGELFSLALEDRREPRSGRSMRGGGGRDKVVTFEDEGVEGAAGGALADDVFM